MMTVAIWLSLAFLVIGLGLGFYLGRWFPHPVSLDAAWRAGWRASDGGVPPHNAKAYAEEKQFTRRKESE